MSSYGANFVFGPYVRAQSPGVLNSTDAYSSEFVLGGTQGVRIREYVDSVPATLGSQTNQTITSGDGLGIDAIGSTMGAYFNNNAGGWTQLQTQSDGSVTAAGNIALQLNRSGGNVGDDFGGGDVSAPAAADFFPRRRGT